MRTWDVCGKRHYITEVMKKHILQTAKESSSDSISNYVAETIQY